MSPFAKHAQYDTYGARFNEFAVARAQEQGMEERVLHKLREHDALHDGDVDLKPVAALQPLQPRRLA